MIEVKSGDTYTGTLENIDRFMNIKLIDAIMTSKVCFNINFIFII